MKWEYKKVHYLGGYDETAERLNEEGQNGWECFAVNLDQTFYFKRPVVELLNEEHGGFLPYTEAQPRTEH